VIDLQYGRDVLDVLREMESDSVHVCCTSPPYFGLRDYGCAGQIGLEPTLQEFIAKLVAVFAEVHRVLHPSGTLWINLGDSYASGKGTCFNPGGGESSLGKERKQAAAHPLNRGNKSDLEAQGLKPKDLMMVPSRFAIAMQDWVWYLRDFIVWHKPAPMPESVTDRCTKAWEPIFMFAKSPKYYADMEAVKQQAIEPVPRTSFLPDSNKDSQSTCRVAASSVSRKNRDGEITTSNLRNVWTLSPESFPGKHFATFPSELPRKCIMIGSSAKGCCPHCLAPWVRVVESNGYSKADKPSARKGADINPSNQGTAMRCVGCGHWSKETTGWAASCQCPHTEAETIPCRVLDPFSGSGTTGRVAFDLGRDYIGIDLNKEYEALARERIGGLFLTDAIQ